MPCHFNVTFIMFLLDYACLDTIYGKGGWVCLKICKFWTALFFHSLCCRVLSDPILFLPLTSLNFLTVESSLSSPDCSPESHAWMCSHFPNIFFWLSHAISNSWCAHQFLLPLQGLHCILHFSPPIVYHLHIYPLTVHLLIHPFIIYFEVYPMYQILS